MLAYPVRLKPTDLLVSRKYQQPVRAAGYLLRKLNGTEAPSVTAGKKARAAVIAVADTLIGNLHQDDFETLVDLILNRSGWHRISAPGGIKKDTDIRIFDGYPSGEAEVSAVRSGRGLKNMGGGATTSHLDSAPHHSIISRSATALYDRMIFACHESKATLSDHRSADILVWDSLHLQKSRSKTVYSTGLSEKQDNEMQ